MLFQHPLTPPPLCANLHISNCSQFTGTEDSLNSNSVLAWKSTQNKLGKPKCGFMEALCKTFQMDVGYIDNTCTV